MNEPTEILDECSICGEILKYAWETDVCKSCLNRFKIEKEKQMGDYYLGKFVWVKKESIDTKGEWLKVRKTENEKLLCERKNPFKPDVYIEKSDVLHVNSDDIF